MVVAQKEDLLAPDLEKHRGQWVAIKDGEVVASGQTAVDVVRELGERHITGAALHHVAETPDAAYVL